jgi:hypothetical protein
MDVVHLTYVRCTISVSHLYLSSIHTMLPSLLKHLLQLIYVYLYGSVYDEINLKPMQTRVIGKSRRVSARVTVHGNKDKLAGRYGIQGQWFLLRSEGE